MVLLGLTVTDKKNHLPELIENNYDKCFGQRYPIAGAQLFRLVWLMAKSCLAGSTTVVLR